MTGEALGSIALLVGGTATMAAWFVVWDWLARRRQRRKVEATVKPFWIQGRPPTCPRCPYAGVRGNFCPRCGWQFATNGEVLQWLEGRREVLRLQGELAEASAVAVPPGELKLVELGNGDRAMLWFPGDGGPPRPIR